MYSQFVCKIQQADLAPYSYMRLAQLETTELNKDILAIPVHAQLRYTNLNRGFSSHKSIGC